MLKSSSLRVFGLLLAVLLVAFATPRPAAAALLYKLSGVMLIDQGYAQIVGGASVAASRSGHTTTYKVVANVNNAKVTQIITTTGNRSGRATVKNLLPGVKGFEQKAVGKFKSVPSQLVITAPLPAPYQGTLKMTFKHGLYGTTTIISSVVSFANGGLPIFNTVVTSPAQ